MMKFIVAFTEILYAFYKRVYFSLHKRILKAKGLDFGISFDIHWGVDFWGTLQNMHFGIGVSTNGQSVWQQRIRHDNQVGLQLIWPYLTIAEKMRGNPTGMFLKKYYAIY